MYLGYVYDDNGYHNGAIELETIDDVVNLIFDKKYLNNDKMITDIFDMHVVNTIGCFIDRFGPQVSSSERNEILGKVMKRQEELGLVF